jgi:hypothetical protein
MDVRSKRRQVSCLRQTVLLIAAAFYLTFFPGVPGGNIYGQQVTGFRSGAEELKPVHITDIINTPEFIDRAIKETELRNPDLYKRVVQDAVQAAEEDEYEVGDERTFYILKFEGRSGTQLNAGWFDEVTFRLMQIGDLSQIWVSVEELENEHVTQTEVDAIYNSLEVSTSSNSRDPDRGIFDLVETYFGLPPNMGPNGIKGMGDGKTSVLITDIKDGWEPGQGFVAGFFFSYDQGTGEFSNRGDIIYVDSYPGIYNPSTESRNPSRPLSTLAHEFQHLVFHNYRGTTTEETWLNEGLSEYSEAVCGFALRSPGLYFANTNRAMNSWSESTSPDVLADYSRVALWTQYIAEQMGEEFVRHLVQLPASFGRGVFIVNRAAQEVGSDLNFAELFRNFTRANVINDKTVDQRYGYTYSFGGRPEPKQYHNDPNVSRNNIGLQRYASYYIEYAYGDSLEITFTSPSDISITAVEIGADEVSVVPIAVGEKYQQWEYGTRYRSIMFVVTNTSASNTTFSYESTGGFRYYVDEYSFDDGTPRPFSGQAAYLGFPGTEAYFGSGWAVRFTPELPENVLVGARIYAVFEQEFDGSDAPLDSPKSFLFHVWGDDNGAPGEELIEPFAVETVRDDFPGTFLDVDLMGYADQLTNIPGPVYIGFTHNTNYSVYVGMTNMLQTSNRTYAFFGPNHPNSPNQWSEMFDLSVGDGVSLRGWNMMMRALFAVYDPDRDTGEIPETYALMQNYPNPFNQSTTILYELPNDGRVTIRIYDILGREVRTLVDEFKEEGIHPAVWNSRNNAGQVVSSGVYFYRMTAGADFSSVKKMVFVR